VTVSGTGGDTPAKSSSATTAKSGDAAKAQETDEEKNKALEPTGRAKNPPGKTDKQ
jgi:hypothetical protein